ncbi:exosortase A [Calidifontimicrobium sp. SYSU G02091]|uniref:exosortase A n=1 Tax=Calidifontimicrobium sp. SYSU G02091 TaxID=2926421 RepID=UPI001F53B362|nr:exosortase A [Calidifontimicrobium sp. SYSU G02091]MCI1193124.1 exosortase A [Calidifontimicrobium sp. SYSU G02091]
MSAIPADLRLASPWRSALPAVVGLVVAIALMYRDTLMAMVDVWSRSDTFAHGWVVAPISLWLIWRQRERLAALTPKPAPWVLLPMAALALAWFAADLVVVNAPAQFAFVGLLILAVPAVLGVEVTRAILFPLLFLLFAVPFGEFTVQPMMEWTADFVVLALQWTGVPVYRTGLHFVIPSGSWSVIDECSGVRYLMASFMVGSLFAYLNYRSYRKRAVFMAFSLVVPIVANWLRAYMIVMLGHLSGNRIAVGVDHILYGWVFFGIVIFVMFVVGMRWADPDEPPAGAPAPGLGAAASQAATQRALAVLAGAAIVALAPHAALWGMQASERAQAAPQLQLPASFAAWSAVEAPAIGWSPHFVNPSLAVTRSYSGPPGTVTAHVFYYRAQNAERKLVNSLNGLVSHNERQWTVKRPGTVTVDLGGQAVTLRSAEVVGPERGSALPREHLVVWHGYWVDGRFLVGDLQAKLAGAASRLRGHGDDGAVIVLQAAAATPEASTAALQAFARDALGELAAALERTQAGR